VFALGPAPIPVVRQAIHDVDRPRARRPDSVRRARRWAGLLAEKAAGQDSAPGPRLLRQTVAPRRSRASLKFARFATKAQGASLYIDHAFHGPDYRVTVGETAPPEFRKGFDPLLPDAAIPFGPTLSGVARRELRKGPTSPGLDRRSRSRAKGVAHRWPPGVPGLGRRSLLQRAQKRCLIADEVQSGIGRSGEFWSYQYERRRARHRGGGQGRCPGGYIPVGATLGPGRGLHQGFSPRWTASWVHDSTFGFERPRRWAAGVWRRCMSSRSKASSRNARKVGEVLHGSVDRAGRPLRD